MQGKCLHGSLYGHAPNYNHDIASSTFLSQLNALYLLLFIYVSFFFLKTDIIIGAIQQKMNFHRQKRDSDDLDFIFLSLSVINLVTTRCKHLGPWMFEIIRFMCTSQLKWVLTVRFLFSDFISYHNKSSHTWYKHRFDCERATLSTSCIWPRADTVTRRDENEGRNLSSRGFNMTCMGVTARITRRSYTMRKRSTDKFPCLNKPNMYKLIIHYHFSTRGNCNSLTFILTKRSR